MMLDQRNLGTILLEFTKLTPTQLDEGLAFQKEKNLRLGEALTHLGYLNWEDVLRAISLQMGMDYVSAIDSDSIPSDLIHTVPINFAKKNDLIPLRREEGHVVIALADPMNHQALDDLRIVFEAPIKPVIAAASDIVDAIVPMIMIP